MLLLQIKCSWATANNLTEVQGDKEICWNVALHFLWPPAPVQSWLLNISQLSFVKVTWKKWQKVQNETSTFRILKTVSKGNKKGSLCWIRAFNCKWIRSAVCMNPEMDLSSRISYEASIRPKKGFENLFLDSKGQKWSAERWSLTSCIILDLLHSRAWAAFCNEMKWSQNLEQWFLHLFEWLCWGYAFLDLETDPAKLESS